MAGGRIGTSLILLSIYLEECDPFQDKILNPFRTHNGEFLWSNGE